MDRIATATKAVDLYGAGKHGFKNGNLGLGVAPTDLNAEWFNGVQEELLAVIENAGLTPSAGTLTQLRQAIAIMTGLPAGEIAYFARNTAPTGYLKANGAAVSRTTYVTLFTAIGTTFGAGDGSTTFNLPDLRGEFVRGWDDSRGVDSGRVFGSSQTDAIKAHAHTVVGSNTGGAGGTMFVHPTTVLSTYNGTTDSFGTTETRPRNIALLACIKY